MLKKIISALFISDKFIFTIRLIFILAFFAWLYEQNWMAMFVIVLAFLLTYFYVFFEKYNIFIPKEFQIIIIFFIFASLFLWEVHNYYEKYYWWDSLLHTFSWLALWFVWFLILYIFHKWWSLKAPAWIIAMFAFCFALALWALWEIFEFLMDEKFWLNMQRARWLEEIYWVFDTRLWVRDTMIDLMLDSIWALVASIAWYIYLKKWETIYLFELMLKKFEESNKLLFKRK